MLRIRSCCIAASTAVTYSSFLCHPGYKQEAYAEFGELNYADASRKAVEVMIADIDGALQNR